MHIDGVEVGRSNSSLDCDVWAAHIAKAYTEVVVDKHRADRGFLMEQLENARKEKAAADKKSRAKGTTESKEPQQQCFTWGTMLEF